MKRMNGERDVEMIRVGKQYVAVEATKKGGVVKFLLHTVVKGLVMVGIIYLTLKMGGML